MATGSLGWPPWWWPLVVWDGPLEAWGPGHCHMAELRRQNFAFVTHLWVKCLHCHASLAVGGGGGGRSESLSCKWCATCHLWLTSIPCLALFHQLLSSLSLFPFNARAFKAVLTCLTNPSQDIAGHVVSVASAGAVLTCLTNPSQDIAGHVVSVASAGAVLTCLTNPSQDIAGHVVSVASAGAVLTCLTNPSQDIAGHVVSVASAAAVLPHPATVLGTPSSASWLLVYWLASQLINSKPPALGHLVGDGGFISDHWRWACLLGNGRSLKMDTPGWGWWFCKCSLKMGMPGWVWWPDWSQVFLAGDSGPTEVRWYTWLAGDGGPTEVRCSWLGMVAWLKSGVPGWGWWPDWSQVFLAGYGGLTEVRCSWLGMVAWLKSGVPGWG